MKSGAVTTGAIRLAAAAARHCENHGRCARRRRPEAGGCHPAPDENRWLGDYGSLLRDNAPELALLEENKLLPEVQNQLLSTLSEEAYGQRWLSTQKPTPCSLPDAAGGPAGQLAGANLAAGGAAGRRQSANPQSRRRSAAALQVSNTGSQPLWLRLDSSGYPQSRAAAGR